MKKIIAVLLSVLCIFSVFAVSASAELDKSLDLGLEDDKTVIYAINYKNDSLEVTTMYTPLPTINFKGPGTATITNDTPIAVDHDFVCWRDDNGNRYYEGDKIEINGEVTLYAVWEPKTDSYPQIIRTIRCFLLTFERRMLTIFGVIKTINDYKPIAPPVEDAA